MTLVELSFIAIAFIGVFGVIGIAAVVTGRTPKAVTKRLNWKKNLDKKALKVDKSETNFLAPDEPDYEEENVSEDDEQEEEEIQTDGSIAIKEEIIYEEISEEEILQKIKDRNTARDNKNYQLADEIRNELLDKGILIEDKDDKTTWKIK